MLNPDNDIEMVTVSDGHPDRVVNERHAYGPTGEPRGDGPRCATCGDLGAWGEHPLCACDDRDRLLVHLQPSHLDEVARLRDLAGWE